MKQTITRDELAAKFTEGVERKRREQQDFILKAFENPEKGKVYQEIADFLDYEIRYYRLCAAYYSDEFESMTSEEDDDLLYLTAVSEPSPRAYAQYLREIDPSVRADEKITHSCLKELKSAIGRVMGSGMV
mgnify:FL=1